MTFRPALVAAAAFALSALSPPARAEAVLARYDVRAGGVNVMRVEVLFDLSGPRYRVQTKARPVGVGATFSGGGEQVSATEGSWRGADPVPRRHSSEGAWRGGRRAVQLDYAPPSGGAPLLRVLEPPLEPEREPVPDALQRNTVDGLSAVAKLLRAVAQTGRCEGEAPVYDGRRRSDFRAWTEGSTTCRGAPRAPSPARRCAAPSWASWWPAATPSRTAAAKAVRRRRRSPPGWAGRCRAGPPCPCSSRCPRGGSAPSARCWRPRSRPARPERRRRPDEGRRGRHGAPGPGIRPFAPEDLPAMQRVREAAFAPVFRSFAAAVGEGVASIAFARADAEQARLLEGLCGPGSGHEVLVATAEGGGARWSASRRSRSTPKRESARSG
jgi:hypothetical protein